MDKIRELTKNLKTEILTKIAKAIGVSVAELFK